MSLSTIPPQVSVAPIVDKIIMVKEENIVVEPIKVVEIVAPIIT